MCLCSCFLRLVYIEKEENTPTKKLYFTDIRNEHAGTYSCSGTVGGNRQEKTIQLLLFRTCTHLCLAYDDLCVGRYFMLLFAYARWIVCP